MKKTNVYLMGLILLIYIIMFRIILMKYFLEYINILNIIFFGILSLWCYFTCGYKKRNSLKDYNATQITIIYFFIYYILIYIMGLYFGFLSNVYSLKLINIIKNIFVVMLFYGVRELFRYMYINTFNRKNKLQIIFITIMFIILDIIMEIKITVFSSYYSMFEFVSISVIPNIAINLLLSYIAYNFNYKTLIIFLIFMFVPDYFMPIFPNLGNYFGVVLKLIFIFYCYYEYSFILEKWEQREKYNRKYGKKIYLIFILIPIFVLVGMISGLFKYHLLAIASNSMVPYFSRGDGVIIEKLSNDELDNLKLDDVLAFYYKDRLMVHRIVNIDKVGDKYLFKTKGDNNLSIDSWTVNEDMIYGRVRYIIKYVGIPSIEISELMNKE